MTKITYSEAIQQTKDMKAKKSELAKTLLADAAKKIFSDHPELEAFKWTQYTPYFNDGDECTFSRHDDYELKLKGSEEFQDEYSLEGQEVLIGEIRKAFNEVEDEDYEIVFGDHCEIIANRDGFHVEEYDHD
jgi:hypothetical protein